MISFMVWCGIAAWCVTAQTRQGYGVIVVFRDSGVSAWLFMWESNTGCDVSTVKILLAS
jgi:hypothetical protein